MKKKKWLLPVCIVTGVLIFCIVGIVITFGIISAKGYGISVGRLYAADIGMYLIRDDDVMIMSDQSNDKDVFSGLSTGDLVFVVHDGVDECYPARTGAYRVFRLSKGDVSDIPDYIDLGVENIKWTDRETYLLNNMKECDFTAQYIRTNGYHEGAEYPMVKIIRSVQELNAYYEMNKERYSLDIGFLDACDKYDAAYFEKQILVMVLLEEGSGSIRHKVENIGLVDNETLVLNINALVPEVGTCDMAEWHILIEPEAGIDVKSEGDVTVFLNGENVTDKPTVVEYSRGYANISVQIPEGWESEIIDEGDGAEFGIDIWPIGNSGGKLGLEYWGSQFGVCGTGLKQKKISIGSYEAYQGTYDNKKVWDFICLIGTPGDYVIMNEGADTWWNEYGDEAMQILSTVVVGNGIINEKEAIEIAEAKATVEYNEIWASFDSKTGIWTVSLYKKDIDGGNQVITISAEGEILDMTYGK